PRTRAGCPGTRPGAPRATLGTAWGGPCPATPTGPGTEPEDRTFGKGGLRPARSFSLYWTDTLNGCVTRTGAGEAWWWNIRQPSAVLRKTLVAWATATPTSPSVVAVMFSEQTTRPTSPITVASTVVGVTRSQRVLAKICSQDWRTASQPTRMSHPGWTQRTHPSWVQTRSMARTSSSSRAG